MQLFDRPTSEDELDRIRNAAFALAMKEEYGAAIAMCEWLMHDPSTAIAGRRERAAVFSHQGNIQAAIADLEHVVAYMPLEPSDFHALGLLHLQAGNSNAALGSFQSAVDAGRNAGCNYYANSSRLLMAEALLRLGDHAAAIAAAGLLPDSYRVHVPDVGMRSKELILSEALARRG